MPQLNVHGITSAQLKAIQEQLAIELAKLCQRPPESIELEMIPEELSNTAMQVENQRLKDEIQSLRKTIRGSESSLSTQMNSRLRDALRE